MMKIEYIPNIGFNIESLTFLWGQSRSEIREKLNYKYDEDDKIIKISDFLEGDISFNIKQKRDIYQNISNEKNYFFLNYNEENKLSEIEVHWGMTILTKGIELNFETDIDECLKLLESIGENYTEIDEGNFLFQNLKMTISSSESIGGEASRLSYFYASKDIEHLIEK